MRDELVQLFERAWIEKKIDALAGRQFPRVVLTLDSGLNRGSWLGARGSWLAQAFTACAFSQSFRNFSRPMLVSGWL
jgi:hypothetical protein